MSHYKIKKNVFKNLGFMKTNHKETWEIWQYLSMSHKIMSSQFFLEVIAAVNFHHINSFHNQFFVD